ncbi:Sec14p-like phosphatidylinositol transfer family protein [Rhynchospora pubera]|uniref:Sec14p-like phosphatidylinositol transfer family protein n=1 Tax=Rhynchospora pubera TaxID=906938 RepID=A0AAV8H239_9POAL|nr:Sec14p-like phosphatidylinositol transfer family protein [Rhynchospora pubera]
MGTVDVEGEWFLVAKMRAFVEAQDPSAKEADNFTLRRFLRARDLDIEKGSSLFLKYLKWRRQAVPNGFISESEIQNELPQRKVCLQGFDKVGRPIVVGFAAKHDYSKRNMDEFKRFVAYFLDKACARMPSGQEKFICIADFKGWGYSHCDIRAYIAALEVMQNYYPERLGKVLLINVPQIFMKTWKVVYPFIDKNTKEKFIFVDDKKLQETLLVDIDESQLPDIYGGKLPLVPIENA